jgi:heat shock protein HslJ
MKKIYFVLLMSMLLLSTAAAAGCTSNVTPSPNATATTNTLPALQLERPTWILTSLATETGMTNTLPDTTITATFVDGNVTGSSGCNRYFGSYHQTQIKIGPVGSTLMFCADPEGVMTQETGYHLLLLNVTSYAISDNKLTLSDSLGNPQLVFEAALYTTTVTATT